MSDAYPLPSWLDVSRETHARLTGLLGLVKKWNPTINLVSGASLVDGWNRHVLDSAQLSAIIQSAIGRWVDVGSGAGFPGLIVAILAKEQNPGISVTLVESDRRKATFLAEAARQLDLQVDVICNRIEQLATLSADTVSARALAPLEKLIGLVLPHLNNDGSCVFLKGQNHHEEIKDAGLRWTFESEILESKTMTSSIVLTLRKIQHA